MDGNRRGPLAAAAAVATILALVFGDDLLCRHVHVACGSRGSDSIIHKPLPLPQYTPALTVGRTSWPQHIEADGVPEALEEHLRLLPGAGRQIRSVAINGAGKWLILHDSGVVHVGAPAELLAYLAELRVSGHSAVQVAFTASGDGWAVLDELGRVEDRGASIGRIGLGRDGDTFRGFGVSPSGWALLRSVRGSVFGGVLPERLQALLRQDAVTPLRTLAMASGDRFVAVGHNGRCESQNVPERLLSQLASLCPQDRLRIVALTPEGEGWVVVGDLEATPDGATAH
jgi:hypothetical protein